MIHADPHNLDLASVELDFALVGTHADGKSELAAAQDETNAYAEAFNGATAFNAEGVNPITAAVVQMRGPGGGNLVIKFSGGHERIAALYAHYFGASYEINRQHDAVTAYSSVHAPQRLTHGVPPVQRTVNPAGVVDPSDVSGIEDAYYDGPVENDPHREERAEGEFSAPTATEIAQSPSSTD